MREPARTNKAGMYLVLAVLMATITYIVVHLKISTVLDEAESVTKMISNKYTTFRNRHSSSESSTGTYISSVSTTHSTSIKSDSTHDIDISKITPIKSKIDAISSKPIISTGSNTNAHMPPHPSESSGDIKISTNRHPILALSDDDFRKTTIDVMMGWYDASTGADTCDEDFGNKLIHRWRGTKATFCASDGNNTHSSFLKSQIDCYLIRQANHHGNGDNLCVMNNVSVNFGLFGNDNIVRSVVKTYVDTRHDDQPYVHFSRGFVQGTCSPVNGLWEPKFMPGWNEDWTISAFEKIPNNNNQGQQEEAICDEWIEHPVLIIQRDTFANFFHDSEDFFNVFIAMAVLQRNFDNVQIYLTDLYPRGPFWEIWAKPFSGRYPVLDAWDLRQKFGHSSPQHRVCFRDLSVGIYGPAAPITIHTWETPCHGTALVRAYSDYIIRGLNLQKFSHYAQEKPLHTLTVTYLARRASTVWPEKKFCNDTHSFFVCELWKDWGIRSLGRMLENDKEVVDTLKTLETAIYKNGAKVIFQDVDYNLLSFEDQIKVDLQTDILVGPHGAGLMHNIFMRDRATLIELSVDGSGNLRHFYNLAHWYGRNYVGLNVYNPIDVKLLYKTIVDAIEGTNLNEF